MKNVKCYSKRNISKTMIAYDTDEIIQKLFDSLLQSIKQAWNSP